MAPAGSHTLAVYIALNKAKPTFVNGDSVAGTATVISYTGERVEAINIKLTGRLSVDIKSRNPAQRASNTTNETLLEHVHTLWQGQFLTLGTHIFEFAFQFPKSNTLPPSYADGDSVFKSGTVCKGFVEYFLEVSILTDSSTPAVTERLDLEFIPHRFVDAPKHVPLRLSTEFTIQSALINKNTKPSLRDRLKISASPSDPMVHYMINFVHSSEAVVSQSLHFFLDLTHQSGKAHMRSIPPVYLKALKVALVEEHTLSTTSSGTDTNNVPTEWSWAHSRELVRFKTADAKKMILLFDKMDLRPHFKQLLVPMSTLPSSNYPHVSLTYHLEIQAEFECMGKTTKTDNLVSQPVKIHSRHPPPWLRPALSAFQSDDLTDEDHCPVCQKILPQVPPSARQEHLARCFNNSTTAKIPPRPKNVLVVDDYSDFTSPILVACLTDLKRKSDLFTQCIGRVVWAEHEEIDVLQSPQSQDALQALLLTQGIRWSRLPNRHFWEAENLNSYDLILYSGRNIAGARETLRRARTAWQDDPSIPEDSRATLVDMASLVPRQKWPYDGNNIETAWRMNAGLPQAQLRQQWDVLKDCCLQFAWQYFRIALPGFDGQGRVVGAAEMSAVVPAEMAASRPLPQQLPSLKDLQELEGSEPGVDTGRSAAVHENTALDSEDEELYSMPPKADLPKNRDDVAIQKNMDNLKLHNADDENGFSSYAAPSATYELL